MRAKSYRELILSFDEWCSAMCASTTGQFAHEEPGGSTRFGDEHLRKAIQLVISGKHSLRQLVDWANALECDDGIDVDPRVKEALFSLANAEINGICDIPSLRIYYDAML